MLLKLYLYTRHVERENKGDIIWVFKVFTNRQQRCTSILPFLKSQKIGALHSVGDKNDCFLLVKERRVKVWRSQVSVLYSRGILTHRHVRHSTTKCVDETTTGSSLDLSLQVEKKIGI